jgi:GNAT superfamily N-acetyltransferase
MIPFKNHHRVVWLENANGMVLGGICFEYFQDRKEGWIFLSFTDPKFRGQGINQICHTYFERLCKDYGATSIGSTVSVNNASRLKSAKKVGLEPLFYKMFKQI